MKRYTCSTQIGIVFLALGGMMTLGCGGDHGLGAGKGDGGVSDAPSGGGGQAGSTSSQGGTGTAGSIDTGGTAGSIGTGGTAGSIGTGGTAGSIGTGGAAGGAGGNTVGADAAIDVSMPDGDGKVDAPSDAGDADSSIVTEPCSQLLSAGTCDANAKCRWVAPGCAYVGIALPAAGCYDRTAVECTSNYNCSDGQTCVPRVIHPCPGMACGSCGIMVNICL